MVGMAIRASHVAAIHSRDDRIGFIVWIYNLDHPISTVLQLVVQTAIRKIDEISWAIHSVERVKTATARR